MGAQHMWAPESTEGTQRKLCAQAPQPDSRRSSPSPATQQLYDLRHVVLSLWDSVSPL